VPAFTCTWLMVNAAVLPGNDLLNFGKATRNRLFYRRARLFHALIAPAAVLKGSVRGLTSQPSFFGLAAMTGLLHSTMTPPHENGGFKTMPGAPQNASHGGGLAHASYPSRKAFMTHLRAAAMYPWRSFQRQVLDRVAQSHRVPGWLWFD
jgi:hypothetical protein